MFKFKSFKIVLMVAAVVLISSLTVGCSKKALQELFNSTLGSMKEGEFYPDDHAGAPSNVQIADRVEGFVREEMPNMGFEQSPGIGSVVVKLSDSNGTTKVVNTYPDGRYVFKGVPMDTPLNINAARPGYSMSEVNNFRIDRSRLQFPGISLRKLDDATKALFGDISAKVVNSSNENIPDPWLSFYKDKIKIDTLNGHDGFVYGSEPIGDYQIEAGAKDYNLSPKRNVTLVSGQMVDITSYPFILNKSTGTSTAQSKVYGKILNQRGFGVRANIVISPEVSGGGVTKMVTDHGDYEILGLPKGSYSLTVPAGSYTAWDGSNYKNETSDYDSYTWYATLASDDAQQYIDDQRIQSKMVLQGQPSVQIVSGPTLAHDKVYTINIKATNTDKIEIKIKGTIYGTYGPWSQAEISLPITLDLTPYQGNVSIEILAYNRAFGASAASALTDVLLSATNPLPTITITSPVNITTLPSNSTITFNVTNATKYQLSYQNANWGGGFTPVGSPTYISASSITTNQLNAYGIPLGMQINLKIDVYNSDNMNSYATLTNITIVDLVPKVTITSPSDSDNARISTNEVIAFDVENSLRYEVYVNNNLLGTSTYVDPATQSIKTGSYKTDALNLSAYANNQIRLQIKVYDKYNKQASSLVKTYTVKALPTVSITSPSAVATTIATNETVSFNVTNARQYAIFYNTSSATAPDSSWIQTGGRESFDTTYQNEVTGPQDTHNRPLDLSALNKSIPIYLRVRVFNGGQNGIAEASVDSASIGPLTIN